VLWTRNSRRERRQKVLDELLSLDSVGRAERLEVALAAGDIRSDEVDEALRLVHMLDAVRVMTVPLFGRFPGGVEPITEHPLRAAEESAAAEPIVAAGKKSASSSRTPKRVGLTVVVGGAPTRRDPVLVSLDTAAVSNQHAALDLAALKAGSGARSSRRRRLRSRIADVTWPALVPGGTAATAATEPSEPSIEWLRP
jgi:hypothetical protein